MNRAFTLLELLVVMTIMVILLSLVVPALKSVAEASDLTQGGQLVADQINLARQYASARNCTVEVRLFKLGDSGVGYGAIQLWRTASRPAAVGSAGYVSSMTPVNRAYKLAQSIAISENTKFSQLLAALPAAVAMSEPGTMNGNKYVAFQIKPDGFITPIYNNAAADATPPAASASGSVMAGVYLTVTAARLAGVSLPARLPSNYVTVQANPYTGTTLIYRP